MSKFAIVKEQWKQKQEIQTRHYMEQKRQRAEEIADMKREFEKASSKNGKPTSAHKRAKIEMIKKTAVTECEYSGYIHSQMAASALFIHRKGLIEYCNMGLIPGAVKKPFKDSGNKISQQWVIPVAEFNAIRERLIQGIPMIENAPAKIKAYYACRLKEQKALTDEKKGMIPISEVSTYLNIYPQYLGKICRNGDIPAEMMQMDKRRKSWYITQETFELLKHRQKNNLSLKDGKPNVIRAK